jgi:thiamine transport system substrate-binding protein
MLRHSLLALAAICAAALGFDANTTAWAQTKPTLTVYTYSSFVGRWGPGAVIKERFEAVCACTLEWVANDNSGAILGRMRLEGEQTRADVVLGLDFAAAAEARATGLFAPHGQEPGQLTLPIAWRDDIFLPFDWAHMAFIYNTEKMQTPPASLRELVENPNGPRIVIQDPRTSQPGLAMVLWMRQVFGDRADAAWAQLKPRIITFTPGWSAAYAMFTRGEADMVLSFTTSPAYHVGAEKKTNFRAAAFAEGHYLYVETAAALRTSKQPELARRFLAFMLSDGFQGAIPETNWMYPAKTPSAGLPASFMDLHRPARTLLFTPEEVQADRRAFIDGWLAATSR